MWIKVMVLAGCVLLSAGADREMMRNAMEHMLQIRPPVSNDRIKRQDQSIESSPNLYMMELYKKYLTSESMKTRSNTIRSIIPQKGKQNHSIPIFSFLDIWKSISFLN